MDEEIGNCDLTDGTWVWPEGLAHYVEKHSVFLTEAVVETMASSDWLVPAPQHDWVRMDSGNQIAYDMHLRRTTSATWSGTRRSRRTSSRRRDCGGE